MVFESRVSSIEIDPARVFLVHGLFFSTSLKNHYATITSLTNVVYRTHCADIAHPAKMLPFVRHNSPCIIH